MYKSEEFSSKETPIIEALRKLEIYKSKLENIEEDY